MAGTFPRPHLIAIGLISLGLCSFVIAKFTDNDQTHRFTTETLLLDIRADGAPIADAEAALDASSQPIPEPASGTSLPNVVPSARPQPAPEPTPIIALAPHTEKRAQVKPGDNLAGIFKREGIPQRELALLLASKPLGPRLKNIFPGHHFTFALTEDNTLVKLAYTAGPLETLEFQRSGNEFVGREVKQEPIRTTAYRHASIDHSLFVASQRAGLDDAVTMRLAQIFQWDIDFVLDIRTGDEFYVLLEELYLGEEFIGYGDILAAEFINQGDSYKAIRYEDESGRTGYFNPQGKSMRKAFLRAPVQFSRISSNFNLRRVHPLFKKKMPHRGIDYAAPSGTPIMASGDGTVATASRTKPNGNFVVIRHGEQFVTKYLHLSKFGRGIRGGAKVKQGQTIGYVGATGWATAPHLHYEFLVNGVHKNPRTVKLPDAAPVRESEKARFNALVVPLISRLESYKEQIQLAYKR